MKNALDLAKYQALFMAESREHLAELARLLVAGEGTPTPQAAIDEIFRHVHSLKSLAATMAYAPIADLAHRLEDVVADCRRSGQLPQPMVDVLLRAVDVLAQQVENTPQAGPEVPTPAEPSVAAPGPLPIGAAPSPVASVDAPAERRGVDTVRIRTHRLDDMLDLVGELFIARQRLHQLLAADEREAVHASLEDLRAGVRQLHDQLIGARLMPLRVLTERYPRMLRDLARSLGKDVRLELDGTEVELDRGVLEALDVPLMHLLRNALDHGIEAPDRRPALGKPAQGRVQLRAQRRRDGVLLICEDDGAGLDAARLRATAVGRGLLTAAAAAALTEAEAHALICLPGLSTRETVSQISGRGVGMDVVAESLQRLGGSLQIDSTLGRGTRLSMLLPLSLAIMPALLVQAGSQTFALPLLRVLAIRDVGADGLRLPGGRMSLQVGPDRLPLWPLGAALQLVPDADALPAQALLVQAGAQQLALGVDLVLGPQEVVVKALGPPLDRLPWYLGATILGEGAPVLILDVPNDWPA